MLTVFLQKKGGCGEAWKVKFGGKENKEILIKIQRYLRISQEFSSDNQLNALILLGDLLLLLQMIDICAV